MSKQTASLHLETKSFMARGMNRAAAQVDRFATRTKSAAKKAHSSVSSLGDKVTALGRANASFMIGLGTIGAVGFGIKKTFDIINAGLQPAQDLQTAMSGVRAVMSSMTDKNMIPQLRAQAVALAGAGDLAFFTAVQVAGAQKMLVKSGMNAANVMKSVAGTMAIAGAEEIALANAADFTTNIMSSFNLQARQSTDAANMLAEASRTSNTNITELADGAAQGGAAFKQFGGSLGEFLALGGTLAGFGIKGGEFGTGIKSMTVSLAKLGELSKRGQDLRGMLGITRGDIVDAQGNIDSIRALSVIGKKLGLDRLKIEDEYGKQTEASARKAVMGNAQVTATLAKIFKQYQFGKVAILAQEAALGKVQNRVELYNKQVGLGTQGAAFDVMQDKLDNVEGSAIRLSSAWNTLLVNLGNPILGAKRGFLDFFTGFLNTTNALITGQSLIQDEAVRRAGRLGRERAGISASAVSDYFKSQRSPSEQNEIAAAEEDRKVKRTFGVSRTAMADYFKVIREETPETQRSETNIILTGNNEFYGESLEQEVGRHVAVSY